MIKLSNKAKLFALSVFATAVLATGPASAKDKDVCKTVRFANPGWSDLTISIGWASAMLQALGYQTSQTQVSTAVTFASLKNKDLDIMLANWLPSDADLEKQYKGNFDTLGTNMAKVRYTLATTPAAYKAGLTKWQDIPKFKAQLNGKIYGIEPGSAGNKHVTDFLKEIKADKDFQVIESSTNAMLSEVGKKMDGYIVYLAWEPHWMSKYNPQYLAGGEKWLGAAGKVTTLGRKDYKSDCPNVAKFFSNYLMNVDEISKLIGMVDIEKKPAAGVVKAWLKANPAQVEKWMKGVTTFDGQPGMPAVKTALGM
ncbi:MAG: glycine betaine ABC transporter substrate-binding protein [Hydrotalea sp.]|nr:glycine betaine ABC transporter substrate-binding protein [Hydrotalea sp.]